MKFRQECATDEFTQQQALCGDEIIPQLLYDNRELLPIAIDHHGQWEQYSTTFFFTTKIATASLTDRPTPSVEKFQLF